MMETQPKALDGPKPYWLILWFLITIVWFASLGTRALIHTDEGRYATLSLGMLQSGDWVTPRLNGLLYFEKPPLQYWAGAISFSLFGLNEFAARFWPGVTGLLTVAVVWAFSRALWGARVGRLAALVVAGTSWIIANSHFLTLDMGASFFLTLALCSFLLAHDDRTVAGRRRWLMWLCWAAMAGATLSKGLIGLLIPGASLVLYSAITGHWALWRRMHWLGGLAVYLAIAAPWFILVSARNPSFADFFFIHEHFTRFLTHEHRREGPAWYFVPILIIGFFPWSSLIGQVVREGWRRSASAFQSGRFLLIWCAFTFCFFSVSGSKLPSYILPMFPAMGMLLARALDKLSASTLRRHLLFPALVYLPVLFSPLVVERMASVSVPLDVVQDLARYLTIAGAIGLVGVALAWHVLRTDRITGAVMILAVSSVLAVSTGMAGHDNYGNLMKSSKIIADRIAPLLRPDTEVYSVQTYDQTFPFYLRRTVTLVDFQDEFALGEKIEPERWIADLNGFKARWHAATSAVAMMPLDTYEVLSRQGLPMKVAYQDRRRMVVAKP